MQAFHIWHGLDAEEVIYGEISAVLARAQFRVKLKMNDEEVVMPLHRLTRHIVGGNVTFAAGDVDNPDTESEEEGDNNETPEPEPDSPETIRVGTVDWTYDPNGQYAALGQCFDDRSMPEMKGPTWHRDMDLAQLFRRFFFKPLPQMALELNILLCQVKQKPTNADELGTWYALFIGAVLHGGRGIGYLWEKEEPGKRKRSQRSLPQYGRYMSQGRFDRLKHVMVQSFYNVEDLPSNPWVPADNMIKAFNLRRDKLFTKKGGIVVVDESMSSFRPKSKTGNLPSLSYIQRKPKPLGTELKVAADGDTGIITHLELQKKADLMHQQPLWNLYGTTTACTARLTEKEDTDRVTTVFGDSWFASVKTARTLMKRREGKEGKTFFTGIVKTAHADFPKDYLTKRMKGRGAGSHCIMTATIDGDIYYAVGYRHTRCKTILMITNRGNPIAWKPYIQKWHDEFGNPCMRSITRYRLVHEYFYYCNVIDSHNQLRQAELALEERWVTQDGFFRIFTTLVAMTVTDMYRAYVYYTQADTKTCSILWFVDRLVTDLLTERGFITVEDGEHKLEKIPANPLSKSKSKQVQKRCTMCTVTGTKTFKTMWQCSNPLCRDMNNKPIYLCKDGSGEPGETARYCHSKHIHLGGLPPVV